jgi:predicted MFS family arabinose efflux permease
VRGAYRPVRAEAPTSVRRDMADGVRWLSRHPLLRGHTQVSAATAFVQSMGTGVLVLYVLEVLRLPSSAFGLVLLGTGVGGLLGGVLTPALTRRLGRAAMLTGGAVVAAVAEGALSLTTSGVVATALGAVSAAGVMVWNVLTMSLRQSLIPEAVFGRVQGAYRTVVWGGIALGSVAGGAVAHAIGLRPLFAVLGTGMLVLAVVLGVLLHRHAAELTDEVLGKEAVPV